VTVSIAGASTSRRSKRNLAVPLRGLRRRVATWDHAAELKIAAGVDAPLMREMGARLFTDAAREKDRPPPSARP
jgi:hypothetical protein